MSSLRKRTTPFWSSLRNEVPRTNINDAIVNYFSGNYPNKYLNNQTTHQENLQRELEARKSKSADMLYRKQLKEHQNKLNYYNEIHKIRGILSQNDTRLPIGTRERLNKRIEELKNLKYGAFDSLADIRNDIGEHTEHNEHSKKQFPRRNKLRAY